MVVESRSRQNDVHELQSNPAWGVKLTPLCELAKKYGTDKGGEHLKAGDTCHNYTPTYYELFKDRRYRIKSVLEIGVAGGNSLRMWRDFFDYALIFGIDHNPLTMFKDERIFTFVAEQDNERDLHNVVRECFTISTEKNWYPRFDLIVDDGSHVEDHQVFSAQVLLPHLAKDGFYVIEDLHYDCKPQRVGNRITGPYYWEAICTGVGLGRAHCECGCGINTPEQLLVLRRNNG